jgi:uracil-DNA glycosylase
MFDQKKFIDNVQNDWKYILEKEIKKNYFIPIMSSINTCQKKKLLSPEPINIFRAFDETSLTNLKLVILGQDPYHGENQANGLAFGVDINSKTPPSLKNIFKEVYDSTHQEPKANKDLKHWAQQGILLLNTSLSVELFKPNSHSKIGWNKLTDTIIREISIAKKNIVFFLWGKNAQKKESLIDSSKHLVLKSSHPSPLSAFRGFSGCNHFSIANNFFKKNNLTTIDW